MSCLCFRWSEQQRMVNVGRTDFPLLMPSLYRYEQYKIFNFKHWTYDKDVMQYIHLQHLLFQKLFSTKQTTNTSTQLTPHISFPSNQTSVFFVFQAHGNSSGIVHSCRFRMDMELCPEPLSLTSRLEVAPISVPCFFFCRKKNRWFVGWKDRDSEVACFFLEGL